MIDTKKFALLPLELAVFHRILRHSKGEKIDPIISEKLIRFGKENQDKSKFLKGDLIKVIHNKGISISFSDVSQSETPSLIKEIFLKLNDPAISGDEKARIFLQKSKTFAEKLNSFQKLTMPGGILAILYGTIETQSNLVSSEIKTSIPKSNSIKNKFL